VLVLPAPGEGVLLGVFLFAASVWMGGWVSAIAVARSTSATLSREDRVAFFRHFGRHFGIVTGAALAIALGCGLVLLLTARWTGTSSALVVASAVLVVVLLCGVTQARGLTRMRAASIAAPGDRDLQARIQSRARAAAILRGSIGVLSVLILVLAVWHVVAL